MEKIYEGLCEICGEQNVLLDEIMKEHTSFKIGGPAKYFVTPSDGTQLTKTVEFCNENNQEYFVLGNGTNLLVSDTGYDGVIIQIRKYFNELRIEGDMIYAGAGCLLSKVAAAAAAKELEGFEFAAGIPGTVGGAVVMNAGAYGSEIKDVIEGALVCIPGIGEVKVPAEKLELGYRTSVFEKNDWIITGAVFKLKKGSGVSIENKMNELREMRKEKQPLEFPSAGSSFKRPEGNFAGKLIEDAGLKGFSIGGAQISEKHAGFIINRQDADASQVMELYRYTMRKVEETSGVKLVPEVKFLGNFDEK